MFDLKIFNIDLGKLVSKESFGNSSFWMALGAITTSIAALIFFFIKCYIISNILFFTTSLFVVFTPVFKHRQLSEIKNTCELEKEELNGKLESMKIKVAKAYDQFTSLHEIIHQTRNALHTSSLENATNGLAKLEIPGKIIGEVLDRIASIFSDMLSIECTTSIMLPDKENVDTLVTNIRSSIHVLSSRVESNPTKLLKGQGMAGKCFVDGLSRWSNDFEQSSSQGKFFPVRENWDNFYKSGMSSPFKVNGKISGVFNLDCKEKNRFEHPDKLIFLVQFGGDTVALATQISEFLHNKSAC